VIALFTVVPRQQAMRVHTHISIDDRDGESGAISSKVSDIGKHLGRELKTYSKLG